jgi:hypothetical protein
VKKQDDKVLGTFALILVISLGCIWFLKFILSVFFVIAESVIVLSLYGVALYAILIISFSLYGQFFKQKTPAIVDVTLKFHHGVASFLRRVYKSFKKP